MNDIIPPENIRKPKTIDVRTNAIVKDFDEYLVAARREKRKKGMSVDCAFVWGAEAWEQLDMITHLLMGFPAKQGVRYMGCNHYLKGNPLT